MNPRSRSHLSDESLRRSLALHLAAERGACAELLADLGEVDARRLYREDGYSSMHDFCVGALRFTPGRAYKRIHVARKARRFPVILDLVARGKLCLSGVMLLASHLTEDNARELLDEAAGRTVADIELMLARRFPRADVPTKLDPIPTVAASSAGSPGKDTERPQGDAFPVTAELSTRKVGAPQVVANAAGDPNEVESGQPSPGAAEPNRPTAPAMPAPATPELPAWSVPPAPVPARIKPLAPERYSLQATIDQAAHDDLRRAMDLLGHRVPRGDVAEVLKRALRLLVQHLEKRKFAETDRPVRRASKPSANPRHVPAHVKRAVYRRDGGQCTFVGSHGRRCEARGAELEYDHAIPVGRGGRSTIGNLRLRCRAHNQLEAERTYGAALVRHKRIAASAARARLASSSATAAAGA